MDGIAVVRTDVHPVDPGPDKEEAGQSLFKTAWPFPFVPEGSGPWASPGPRAQATQGEVLSITQRPKPET